MSTLTYNLATLLQLVSPARCLLCAVALRHTSVSCTDCASVMPALLPATGSDVCPGCALPSTDGLRCGSCHTNPPVFETAIAAFWFEPPVDRIIRGLKFHQRLAAGPPLGVHLAQTVLTRTPERSALPGCIVPVPLGPRRQRQRGFNQATEIARAVSRTLVIPVEADAIIRVRETDAQTDIPASARERNVRNAFACRRTLTGHVAVVDDVMTTAATANAVASVCRDAGATRVSVWVAARVVAVA